MDEGTKQEKSNLIIDVTYSHSLSSFPRVTAEMEASFRKYGLPIVYGQCDIMRRIAPVVLYIQKYNETSVIFELSRR